MAKQKEATTLKPLGNRVLVRRLEAEESTKGGIILPDTAKKKQEIVEVIAVGPGKKTSEGKEIIPSVKVGETILIDKYSGQEVSLNDEEMLVVRGDDIIAIIERK
jgi:chaperonin GroES